MTTITINHEQFTIKDTTLKATCPEDSWTKLIYYLHCVECVKYDEYQNITFDDKNLILMLAEVMSPSFFEEKNIFLLMCRFMSSFHKYFLFFHTKLASAATKEFVIAGKRVTTVKLMAFKPFWKEKYYTTPMFEFKDRLIDIHYGKFEKYRNQDKSSACLLI